MEAVNKYGNFAPSLAVASATAAFGIISFSLCVAAEFRRSKEDDFKWDGRFCYLPGSKSFGLAIGALTCLVIAQITGNLLVCISFWGNNNHQSNCKARRPILTAIFLVLSWFGFGLTVILIGTATSMSRSQPFGEGWLDGECYIVKNGVYIASGVLVLFTVSLTVASAFITVRKRQVEQDRKIHAQVE